MSEFDPWAQPRRESVRIFGAEVRSGDRVRLWPQRRADIFDRELAGKIAIVEAIEEDFEGNVHLAVVLEEDPGRDLGMIRQPGHRFFYSPEEVEPLALDASQASSPGEGAGHGA